MHTNYKFLSFGLAIPLYTGNRLNYQLNAMITVGSVANAFKALKSLGNHSNANFIII